ncbi:MAG: hypothetical protein WDZ49_15300, partial [Litorilinea sp.]
VPRPEVTWTSGLAFPTFAPRSPNCAQLFASKIRHHGCGLRHLSEIQAPRDWLNRARAGGRPGS